MEGESGSNLNLEKVQHSIFQFLEKNNENLDIA